MGRKYDLDMTHIYFYLASKADGFGKIIFLIKRWDWFEAPSVRPAWKLQNKHECQSMKSTSLPTLFEVQSGSRLA